MSKIVADSTEMSRSPMNTSVSKQLYSFPKSRRFERDSRV